MTTAPQIKIARVYDDPDQTDGARLLVDRLWPRGVAKEGLRHVDWIREVAPSNSLRKWFGHDPNKWAEFRTRYRAELDANTRAVDRCLAWCRKDSVTLLYASADSAHNQAAVLREYLCEQLQRGNGK
jgi:uncharacterized protein YeaO (DUF488 family)